MHASAPLVEMDGVAVGTSFWFHDFFAAQIINGVFGACSREKKNENEWCETIH
jgi:hypothetical protein